MARTEIEEELLKANSRMVAEIVIDRYKKQPLNEESEKRLLKARGEMIVEIVLERLNQTH